MHKKKDKGRKQLEAVRPTQVRKQERRQSKARKSIGEYKHDSLCYKTDSEFSEDILHKSKIRKTAGGTNPTRSGFLARVTEMAQLIKSTSGHAKDRGFTDHTVTTQQENAKLRARIAETEDDIRRLSCTQKVQAELLAKREEDLAQEVQQLCSKAGFLREQLGQERERNRGMVELISQQFAQFERMSLSQ